MEPAELEEWSARCRDFAAETPADVAHDLTHLQRVVTAALALAQTENAKLEVVLPAAWLHDCVKLPKTSPDRARSAELAAARATQFLRAGGYPEEFLDGIAHAIAAHSFSAGLAPRIIEAKVVQDADRLDALGAIGIARCFATGGAAGRALLAPEDPFCHQRQPDDAAFGVDHFYRKLLKLVETMQTAAGRAEAGRRVDFMRDYLRQLEAEISG